VTGPPAEELSAEVRDEDRQFVIGREISHSKLFLANIPSSKIS
jgi:hypothetical protein